MGEIEGDSSNNNNSSNSSNNSSKHSVQAMVRLWSHEMLRVFSDRLVDDVDRNICLDIISRSSGQHLASQGDLKSCMGYTTAAAAAAATAAPAAPFDAKYMDALIFCDFLHPEMEPKAYEETPSLQVLRLSMVQQLEEYNLVSTKPMRLVLFNYAIQHVARVSRILRTPGGHALLVGVGGSGRQSLTYLAGYMGGFELKQIRITANYSMVDFHDDLKDAMMTAASSSNDDPSNSDSNVVPGTPTIFLLSDTQIQNETMVENISNLLNSGEVPNMMGQEDMANAVESIRQSAKSDRTYMKALEQQERGSGGGSKSLIVQVHGTRDVDLPVPTAL